MTIASVAHVKAKLSAYVKAASENPVVITRNGKAVAAIVPVTDEQDLERLMLGYSPRLRAILSAARERIRKSGGIPHKQFWGTRRAETRAARRQAHQ